MSNCLPFADSSIWPNVAGEAALPPGAVLENEDPPPYARYEWMPVAIGIMAAGGSYPIAFASVALLVTVVQLLWSTVTLNPVGTSVLSAIPLAILYGGMLGFIGSCWAGIVSLVVMPVFYLFVRSLKWRADFVSIAATCGGLVGFVAVLPFMLIPLVEARSELPIGGLLVAFAFGPAITTILGQLGGAWGARRAIRLKHESDAPTTASEPAGHPYIQFSLRHLIWVTAWTSVLLTLIHLSRLPAEFILPLLGVWLVYQAATLAAGRFYLARIRPRLRLPVLRANRST
jgi:hypothetical protein